MSDGRQKDPNPSLGGDWSIDLGKINPRFLHKTLDNKPACNLSHLCIGYLSAAAANRPATPEVFKLKGSGFPSC